MLTDEVHISIKAGDGGSGGLSFRREKYVPKGGPDGGDGGRGGDIYFLATHSTHGLSRFRGQKDFLAENGDRGGRNKRHGKDGEDMILAVPPGTRVVAVEPGQPEELLYDLTMDGQQVLLAAGGRGGKGNWHFRSSTNQTPREFEPGASGQELQLKLELKLIADVGLVGLPNAGKSTLLSIISNAKPKIANYPFTTLQPNLGMVKHRDSEFVVADIPGLIEGAAEGKGLGHEFLKHIQRTRAIVHLVAATEEDPEKVYQVVRDELAQFDPALLERPELVVLSKIDLIPDWKSTHKKFIKKHVAFGLAAVSQAGVTELLDAVIEALAVPEQIDEVF